MEEGLKNRVIIILVILAVIFFLGMIGSCSNAQMLRRARDKEMIARLTAEEEKDKITRDKAALEGQAAEAQQNLGAEKAARQALEKALTQEQLSSQSLKQELEKVTKLKETLEEDLKEALVTDKATKPKK